ncbi:imm11 family protein [Paenibacillus sp. sgz500958]|uniref:imm11 family protein n=1 Tax=Paenibacillus sp. sgz500958 TaxID=3242475 RepID=UPI0036D232E3
MKVYEFSEDFSTTMTLAAVDKKKYPGHPLFPRFKGISKIEGWWPIKLETLHRNTHTDFPYFTSGKPLVSEKVKSILEPYIKDEVEFLPLDHDEINLFLMNVTNILDCVDWERSDAEWFEKYFMRFKKLRFDFTKIPLNTYIFKIKETAGSTVFVTEAFRKLIENHNLQGLDFSEVYDSEFTEEKELVQKRKYEAMLQGIEKNKGPEFSYEEARERVDQNKAVASGKWRMQLDHTGEFWLGDLTLDLNYQWTQPMYIPPILLGYEWHEVERTEDFSNLWRYREA